MARFALTCQKYRLVFRSVQDAFGSMLVAGGLQRVADFAPARRYFANRTCTDHYCRPVGSIGARLVVMHNTVWRLELDPLNFAEEKGSRRRQAWTEG